MEEMRMLVGNIGYEIPESFLDEADEKCFSLIEQVKKINFLRPQSFIEKEKHFREEKKELINQKTRILSEEQEWKIINIITLVKIIYMIGVFEKIISDLEIKKTNIKLFSVEAGKLGGRPKKSKNVFVCKSNGLIANQLNSHILLKYYIKKRPEIFEDLTQEKICNLINTQSFYSFSVHYPFLEDAILSLAYHNKPDEVTRDFFIYTLLLDEFIKEAGVIGAEKRRFIEFLQRIFSGDGVLKFPTVSIDQGKLIVWNGTVLNIDFGITEDGVRKVKIFLNFHIFQNTILEKKNYQLYPGQLNKKLIAAVRNPNEGTKARWRVQIRALFDFIQRDLENKTAVKKSIAFVMASIGYSPAFSNYETFDIKKSVVKKFLDTAIPAISKVGIVVRSGESKKYNCRVDYKIDNDCVVFTREPI